MRISEIFLIPNKLINMNNKPINISIELKEVSPHAIIANYKDYFDLNAGAVILNNFIIVIDPLLFPRQDKELKEVDVPKSPYEPAEDWQIPRALEFLHKYYSNYKD